MYPVTINITVFKAFLIAVLLSAGQIWPLEGVPASSHISDSHGPYGISGFSGISNLAGSVNSFSLTSDTLQINAERLVDGLADAHTLQAHPPDELIITESGADRIVTFQVRFQEMAGGDTSALKTGSDSDTEVFLPDLDQPGALVMILDTFYAVISMGSGHIHLLDENMSYMRSLNVPSWVLNGESLTPEDITSTEIGELYLLDKRKKRVYHFNSNGTYLQYIDVSELEQPSALMYAEESLFVSDSGTGLIHVLTANGHPLATIGRFPELTRVRVYNRLIWVLSGYVLHLFDIYGDHAGNWRLAGSVDPIRDIALIDDQLFILTSGSLYYSGLLQQQK